MIKAKSPTDIEGIYNQYLDEKQELELEAEMLAEMEGEYRGAIEGAMRIFLPARSAGLETGSLENRT